jgi:hypothetical protein
MKSLAFAADAEELNFLYGFSMAVSPFDRLGSPRSRMVEKRSAAQRGLLSLKTANLVAEKNSRPMKHAIASVAPATSSKSPLHQLKLAGSEARLGVPTNPATAILANP